jgi:hypothetical protein
MDDRFNPQQQAPVSWPASGGGAGLCRPAGAVGSLPAAQIAQLRAALARPQAAQLRSLASGLVAPADPIAAKRVAG